MYETERATIIATLKEMVDSGLIINTSGNVSMKIDDHIILSPSGASYATLAPSDILVMDHATVYKQIDHTLVSLAIFILHV